MSTLTKELIRSALVANAVVARVKYCTGCGTFVSKSNFTATKGKLMSRCKPCRAEAERQIRALYPERNREAVRRWRENHPEHYSAIVAASQGMRRLRKKLATVSMTKEQRHELAVAYVTARRFTRLTGEPWVVDHFVPIVANERTDGGERMQVACGLHTPGNLNVIPDYVNQAKGSRLFPSFEVYWTWIEAHFPDMYTYDAKVA
ncbi:MAG: hypothetical protein RJA99_3166 [Pseudomonadota bacterium]|jgi:hypothetical protein